MKRRSIPTLMTRILLLRIQIRGIRSIKFRRFMGRSTPISFSWGEIPITLISRKTKARCSTSSQALERTLFPKRKWQVVLFWRTSTTWASQVDKLRDQWQEMPQAQSIQTLASHIVFQSPWEARLFTMDSNHSLPFKRALRQLLRRQPLWRGLKTNKDIKL